MNKLSAVLDAVEWDVVYQLISKLLTLLACLSCLFELVKYINTLGCLLALLVAGLPILLCLFFTAFTWLFIRFEPGKSLVGLMGSLCMAMLI